ncbi:hypothetical protein [Bradyrhizobium viridifuturi]|uniref:hypothetical protein n=1 Tax=Bradyrhizobium viridifuturi TaxID=1654716 RepID=UPI000AE00A43|nr:hypothetical protein [Bradyrhizobium viridifuturi]
MTRSVKPAREQSNPVSDKVVSRSRRNRQSWSRLLEVLQKRFKADFVWEMHVRTGRSERDCYRWKTGKAAPDFEALDRLINSDIGDLVLLTMTRGSDQPWAVAMRRTYEIAKARGDIEAAQRRLAALERGIIP